MKIHEYQAKSLLKEYGIDIPEGALAETPSEAKERVKKFGGTCVLKAQIHAGGRGKGGGIKIVSSPEEAERVAKNMIGRNLVTHQTGPEGKCVRKILVERAQEIEKEFYLGLIVDRSAESPVIIVSSEGGIEIEEVAARSPEKILKEYIDVSIGITPFMIRKMAYGLGLKNELISRVHRLIFGLYRIFHEKDASLVEINPLILTREGFLMALDAKINFDDNALYRHPEIKELRDLDEEDPLEVEASKFHLSYIRLSGNVGCMVNGAGLAMSTMDIIKLCGGEPANFLDVGGGANREQVAHAFKILMSDSHVKAVLINIFGGIMRCDTVAAGVVEAAKEIGIDIPMVVRLEGTNVEKGKEILKRSGLNFIVASGMKEAADKVVAAAGSIH